jgi:hypothetical protein
MVKPEMAYQVKIGYGRAKVRAPAGVLALSLVVPLYNLWWWAEINRELNDAADDQGLPHLKYSNRKLLFAYALGFLLLFIPTIWSIAKTTQRIRKAQASVEVEPTIDGRIVALLWVFTLGLGAYVYTQREVNKVWRSDEFDVVPIHPSRPAMVAISQPSAPLGPTPDRIERLERLAVLHSNGALSDGEFEAEKRRLLAD